MEAMDAIRIINEIDVVRNMTVGTFRKEKRYRQRTDPFLLSDDEFRMRYRFTKDGVKKIVDLVEADITMDKRGLGTSAILQVLVALRCWGRREVQDDAGDLHGLSQTTVCRICMRVAAALAKHAETRIKMPDSLAEEEIVMRNFKSIKNFPCVIGAIDCTHVKIKKVGGDLSQYYINRKGYYSLNVQAVCDAHLKIRNIVVRWRGSTHDCRIFDESTLKNHFEEGKFKGRLVGDSGYKLTPYLFTPLLRPRNEKDERYNAAHVATRNPIERCFGVWKQRFRCLFDGMTVSLENAKTLIVALAVLHNFAIEENEPVVEYSNDIASSDASTDEDFVDVVSDEIPANRRRANIILRTFIDNNF